MRIILHTSWDLVYLSGFFSFVIYFQYSIFATVTYTYMTKLHPIITPATFGITVTLHGIGHCFGVFVAGYCRKREYQTKRCLLIGHLLMLISNIFFIFSDHVAPPIVVPYFMVGRMIGGIGMGNITTLRTAITSHTIDGDRAKAMSVLIGGRTIGFIIAPGVQLIFLLLGDTGIQILRHVAIHSHNAAAFLSTILNISAMSALLTLYEESEERDDQQSMEVYENYPQPDKLAMAICMCTRFAQNFTFNALETLAPAFIMLMYNMNRDFALATMSALFFTTGIVAITIYTILIFTNLSNRINIGKSNGVALVLLIFYLLSTYQWPGGKRMVSVSSNHSQGGCDYQVHQWCDGMTITTKEFFYLGYIISFGGCFPIINVGDATLYSKLFNPVEQAIQQSFYDISLIFSRIVAPVLCSAIYTWYGPRRVWELLLAQLVVVTFFWIGFSRRMVPLRPLPRPIFYLG